MNRPELAPFDLLARLPAKMLGHPSGGALAVVGQVDRAWGYYSTRPNIRQQTGYFTRAFTQLLEGDPIGLALQEFNQRSVELSIELSDQLEEIEFGLSVQPADIVELWTSRNDAKSLAIMGDPAVRLPVVEAGESAAVRPTLHTLSTQIPLTVRVEDSIAQDDLTQIRVIGPRYQETLQAAGIRTFVRLATTPQERLAQLLRDQGLPASPTQTDEWLEQAAALAQLEPRRSLLFTDEQPGPNIFICQTDRQWHLAVDGLVLPLGVDGGFGGFANAFLNRLSEADRENLTNKIVDSIGPDFGIKAPVLISLEADCAAQLLPNRPKADDQKYFLIASTAGNAEKITDLREAAKAIVKKADAVGIRRLGILPLGTGTGRFQDQVEEVASQMIHGIWAARRDLESSSLAEITFAPTELEAVQAVRDKVRLLTHNRPQEVLGDQPAAVDLLGVKDEAEALAETLLLRKVKPPISVAVLGGWGSGKSTVMRLMMKRMTQARISRIRKGWPDELGKEEDDDENELNLSTRVGHIYQIRFNAWTYAKSNLWASLMQTIFWELNRQLTAEQALFEREKSRSTNGHSPLDAGDEFQFLYDEYGWVQPKLWNSLSLAKRAALQPDADKNVLWQHLRAKQQKVLEDLQQKEAEIARLKAQREQAEAERKKEVIQDLSQDSQAVAYKLLSRKSHALLGELYQQTEKQVERNSKLTLAAQLETALAEIVKKANQALDSLPPTETAAVRDLLQEIIDLNQEFSVTTSDLPDGELGDYVNNLKAKLGEAERIAGHVALLARNAEQPLLGSTVATVVGIKQQAHEASNLTGTVESVEELSTDMRSISTTMGHVRATAASNPKITWTIGILGLVFLLIPVGLFGLYINFPELFNGLVIRLAGFISIILSAITFLGPPFKVAGAWSRRVNGLFAEYHEEVETERQRRQALVETNLAAALAADEQALQEHLNQETAEGQQPTVEALLESADQANLAAINYRLNQLGLEAEELRRQAGPPGEYESLLDFVQARQDEQFYEKRLGLMHQVKRDIDVLTGGLVIQPRDDLEVRQAKRKLFPRGPARVVLYIDDLDRCPPGRVVEVLEAVQLLLNTELFVVVLGLDTRYITRALEKEYKEILQPDGDPSGLDYIEKILQLPYRVRPIGRDGMARFLQAQMQVVPSEEQTTPTTSEETGSTGQPPSAGARAPSSGVQSGPAGEAETSGVSGASNGKTADPVQVSAAGETVRATDQGVVGSGDGQQTDSDVDEDELDEVPPEVIRFQPEDLEDLTACCQMLKLTPRNVKRMVNVLKLIDVFWFRTAGDLRDRQVKSTVMGLLALSAAYPEIMREVLDKIDVSYRNIQDTGQQLVGEFLNVASLPSNQRWLEQYEPLIERFQSDVASLYDPDQLDESLIGVTLAALEEDTFNLVRSFSFVGDPVYLSGDDDGSRAQIGKPKLRAELKRDQDPILTN
jgi:predicted flap endonuclease-1-like 5' DNA nuclease